MLHNMIIPRSPAFAGLSYVMVYCLSKSPFRGPQCLELHARFRRKFVILIHRTGLALA